VVCRTVLFDVGCRSWKSRDVTFSYPPCVFTDIINPSPTFFLIAHPHTLHFPASFMTTSLQLPDFDNLDSLPHAWIAGAVPFMFCEPAYPSCILLLFPFSFFFFDFLVDGKVVWRKRSFSVSTPCVCSVLDLRIHIFMMVENLRVKQLHQCIICLNVC